MVSFNKLMRDLPNGMAGLYKHELQVLDQGSRTILLTAIRWIIRGQRRIHAGLVADGVERTYWSGDSEEDGVWEAVSTDGDARYDKENDEDEEYSDFSDDDSSDIDMGIEKLATTSGSSASGEPVEIATSPKRDTTEALKLAGRSFLKFESGGYISLQHTSVRDFILAETSVARSKPTVLCSRCRVSTHPLPLEEAGLRHGHLLLAVHCLRALDSQLFFFWKYFQTVLSGVSIPIQQANPSLRYELHYWHYHLREAEASWNDDDRDYPL